ncbi:MAG: type II secretion system minor pseudopilin GspH [Woeseiaceae bacterium]
MGTRSPNAGFTLIELLVVIVVIAIILSVSVFSMSIVRDDRELQREVYRIGSLLEVAQDEAVMQGREFGLEIMLNSYRFVEFDPFERIWVEVAEGDQFRFRQLSEDVEIELRLEDKFIELEFEAQDLSEDKDENQSNSKNDYAPHILIFSSGDSTPFELRLVNRDLEQVVILTGDLTGEVEVMTESEKADALLQ